MPKANASSEPEVQRVPPQNLAAEVSVLGSMMQDSAALAEMLELLKPEDFYTVAHQRIFAVMRTLFEQAKPVDLVTVAEELGPDGLPAVGGASYLTSLVDQVPSAANVGFHGRIVKDKAVLRGLIQSTATIQDRAFGDVDDVAELLDWAEHQVFSLSQSQSRKDLVHVRHLLSSAFSRIEAMYDNKRGVTGIPAGFKKFDELTTGFQPADLVVLAARPSMGKAQPIDAMVKTRTGWKQMGELCVGDELASIDGAPSIVDGVFPQGRQQIYRVEMSDGRWTECTAEHLWKVYYRDWDAGRVVDTAKLAEMLRKVRYRHRLWVDMPSGDFGHNEPLPLDPWVLGLLLGDGSFVAGSPKFSSADEELIRELRVRLVLSGHVVVPSGGDNYAIVTADEEFCELDTTTGKNGLAENGVKRALMDLGLWGHRSEKKFVPECYKRASRGTRLEVLRGLLDTDGWVETFQSVQFSSASQRLAQDVVDLVRSLGGWCSVREKYPTYTYKGRTNVGQRAYVCTISHPDPSSLFTLDRKVARLNGRRRQKRPVITSVEPTRVAEAQCILVSHPSRLYITDNYVVTHNSCMALNIAAHVAMTTKQPVAVFSLEMTRDQLMQRLLCQEAKVDARNLRTGYLADADWPRLTTAGGKLSEAPIYIDDSGSITVLEMRAAARRLQAEHGLGLVIVDYLQLISSRKRTENRVQEVSEISRSLKLMAKDLNVPVIALSQLSRAVESRQPPRPQLSDLRDSGSIEQDADVVTFLYRPSFYRQKVEGDNTPEDNTTEVILGKQRNGPTGTVYLAFMQQWSRFVAQDRTVTDD